MVIDLHCDTLLKLQDASNEIGLRENSFCVDIEKLIQGKYLAQFFALFIDIKEVQDPYEACMRMLSCFNKEMEENKNYIGHALTYEDVMKNQNDNKISAFLTIEEGAVLKGKMENVDTFFNSGVRLITLTWNYPNEIGYPNHKYIHANRGLTSFGKDLIEKMNESHIIIDVSHLSDKGFYDVASISKRPFVASHSNSRVITNHSRNLTDEMIRVLADKGGVIGINFCDAFLGVTPVASISSMIKHIEHIRNIGGVDVIALGSDFDGIENEVEIKNSSEMGKLAQHLRKNNFCESDIEKVFYKNALRLIREVL